MLTLQERRIAELESQLAESQQQLEAAQSNRTVTQEALDQASATNEADILLTITLRACCTVVRIIYPALLNKSASQDRASPAWPHALALLLDLRYIVHLTH